MARHRIGLLLSLRYPQRNLRIIKLRPARRRAINPEPGALRHLILEGFRLAVFLMEHPRHIRLEDVEAVAPIRGVEWEEEPRCRLALLGRESVLFELRHFFDGFIAAGFDHLLGNA